MTLQEKTGIAGGENLEDQLLGAEARRNNIESFLAIELSKWGEFKIIGDKFFILHFQIEKGLRPHHDIHFGFDRGKTSIAITDCQASRKVVNIPSIPTERVGVFNIDVPHTGDIRALWAVTSFGMLGELYFGVTKDGTFHFVPKLKA